jgi:hypothetical protein
MGRETLRAAGILASCLLWLPSPVNARPAHKQALADYFGPFLAARLNDCRTCHLPDKGVKSDEDEVDKPHNVFGARLKEIKSRLRKAGKKIDIPSRIEAIADEDSDGDGVSNLLELLSGHFPGDATDKPTTGEVAEARKTLAAFRAYRKTRSWNPFEEVKRPAVPAVRNTSWMRNPVDAFLAAEHAKRGLTPRPEAPRHILLRRVYLDLIGLPPTRPELSAFLADPSDEAYEKVVDRLLDSVRYGERWGRHWMDVWRYSDWAGYGAEVRDSRKHIWHWRDWIIDSLNADKGYDRMIVEMLAGDEIAPTDAKTLRATGFLARNWYLFNRNVTMENIVEHTGKAFLGVTMNCARCHDHFFDPISQKEYFAFRAFFEPFDVRADRLMGQPDINKDSLAHVYDARPDAPTYLLIRGNEASPDKSKSIAPAVPAALGGSKLVIEPVKLPLLAYLPDKREFVVQETLAASAASIQAARAQLARGRKPSGPQVAQEQGCLAELDVAVAEARHDALVAVLHVEKLEDVGTQQKDPVAWKQAATKAATVQRRLALVEGKRNQTAARIAVERAQSAWKQAATLAADKKDKVSQAAAQKAATALDTAKKSLAATDKAVAVAEQNAKLPPTTAYTRRVMPTYPAVSSGRRLALARWIASRDNPLTARVAMNHLWLRHFGKPIVPTVFDFGRNGRPPSHPELLDWLATKFMRSGWSMKAMHRLLVTSSAYRMDSTAGQANLALDADNVLLWRQNARRMEGEVVRDSVLHVAGNLDLTMGGPDLDHRLGLTSRRRSIYFQHAAEKQMEFLNLFDAANVTECYRRSESIIPQQALALANSALVVAQSRLLARTLSREVGGTPASSAAFVNSGFETVLGRPPTAQEQETCEQFLRTQSARLADQKKLTPFGSGTPSSVAPSPDPHQRARESLIHVLMNHNEFVTIR